MTRDELIAAGFREHPSTGSSLQSWDILYQKKITDENGVRYFVEVEFWRHSKYGCDFDGWEANVNYNDGCVFAGEHMWVKRAARNATANDILVWADELWRRLAPNYYERS